MAAKYDTTKPPKPEVMHWAQVMWTYVEDLIWELIWKIGKLMKVAHDHVKWLGFISSKSMCSAVTIQFTEPSLLPRNLIPKHFFVTESPLIYD
jgi:hypothetical protein